MAGSASAMSTFDHRMEPEFCLLTFYWTKTYIFFPGRNQGGDLDKDKPHFSIDFRRKNP
jgi:hypothetical protein